MEAGMHYTLYVALIYICKILFIPNDVWPQYWTMGPLCAAPLRLAATPRRYALPLRRPAMSRHYATPRNIT